MFRVNTNKKICIKFISKGQMERKEQKGPAPTWHQTTERNGTERSPACPTSGGLAVGEAVLGRSFSSWPRHTPQIKCNDKCTPSNWKGISLINYDAATAAERKGWWQHVREWTRTRGMEVEMEIVVGGMRHEAQGSRHGSGGRRPTANCRFLLQCTFK